MASGELCMLWEGEICNDRCLLSNNLYIAASFGVGDGWADFG